MNMKFQVTQEDIDNANGSHSTGDCPVAQCLRRTYPDNMSVFVLSQPLNVHFYGFSIYIYSSDVDEKIGLYDRTNYMEPFEFYGEIKSQC